MKLLCNESQKQIILLGGRLCLMPKGMTGDSKEVADDVDQHDDVRRMMNSTPPMISLRSPETVVQRTQPVPVEVAVTPPKEEPKAEPPKVEPAVHAAEVPPKQEEEPVKEFLVEKATSKSSVDVESAPRPDSKKSRPARRR
jgi:hypothetical protein